MRVVGVLSANGNPTGDKRTIGAPALRWTLPLALRRVREDFGGHNGAVVVGAIEDIKQAPTGELMYSGKLFDTPDGREAYDEMYVRYASSGLKYGISVDLDDVIMEEDPDDPEMAVVTSGRLRGATLCDIPAYATAYSVLESQVMAPALVAAGSPRTDVPASWFQNPKLPEPTPMNVTAEGRIFGHAALWSSCHTAYGDMCVRPPRSATGYAYFNTGIVEAGGVQIPVGHITMATGHADARLTAAPAADHYDNTGSVVADVVAGEDEHGIWLAGTVRDGVTPEQLRELRAVGKVSGDWRAINGNLEMVAMLAVPVPGFPVPRMRAMVASGSVQTLIASASFESEANVEENKESANVTEDVTLGEEPVVEVIPSVDPAEVAPEVVAAEMKPEVSEEDAEKVEEVVAKIEGGDSAPEEEPAPVKMEDIMALLVDLQGQIAELKGAKIENAPEVEATVDAEPVEPVEAVPAIENSQEDILAALDRLVSGKGISDVLAELDAKVG